MKYKQYKKQIENDVWGAHTIKVLFSDYELIGPPTP
jgi:hypothetical protein